MESRSPKLPKMWVSGLKNDYYSEKKMIFFHLDYRLNNTSAIDILNPDLYCLIILASYDIYTASTFSHKPSSSSSSFKGILASGAESV